MSEAVILKRNGDLIHRYWHYNRKRGKGSYKEKKIFFATPMFLHDRNCELEKGITLREIFKFMDKNLLYWDMLIGNWCKEIVTEGLLPPPNNPEKDNETKMTHLELYKHMQISVCTKEHTIEGDSKRMDFHGVGKYLKDSDFGMKKGDRVNLAVEFTPANELAPYEVKIDPTYELWYWNYDDKRKTKVAMKDNPRKYYPEKLKTETTLFEILYGIIWELSFCGGPKSRNAAAASLKKSADDLDKQIKSGKKFKSYKSVKAMFRDLNKKRKKKGKKGKK